MLTTNTYIRGASVRLEARFDVADVLTDPSTVTFRVLDPAGDATVYEYGADAQLVREDAGVYYVDWVADQAGTYCYRFEGTGDASAVRERQFEVEAGCFADA